LCTHKGNIHNTYNATFIPFTYIINKIKLTLKMKLNELLDLLTKHKKTISRIIYGYVYSPYIKKTLFPANTL